MYYSIFDIEEEQRGSGAFQEKVGGGANERLSAVIEHLQEQERYIARCLREGTLGTHSPTLKCDDTLNRSIMRGFVKIRKHYSVVFDVVLF